MNMGLVARTGRHTALDADVVFHEYTHGLSNRLVGGPLDTTALDAPQSGGMGEGWGDYFACVLGGKETVGAWVVDNDRGIRGHRYDQNFPDNFGHLGSGRYTGVHAIGELWCATLMELNRRIGTAVAGQLVVDAMKLSASNPGFLAMRDAILVAGRDFADARGLGVVETDTLTGGIWEAFAHYGMGPGASSIEAGLGPVTTDFTTPPRSSEGPALSHTANPALAIPDNDPRGVASTITIAAGGVVTTASVHVKISHSYQGDLEVRLRAPDGPVTVLHNRSGGSSDDIDETWTSEDDLASLIGRGVAGDWTLEVVDRARFDTGTLDQWTLELTTADQPPSKRIEIAPGLLIPDNNADGVESSAELPGDELIRGLQLELDLTHTYIGDLIITLTGPTGASVVVHDRDGGSADNIIGTFSSTDTSLDAFVDLPVGGTWMLHVADHEGRDVGKLNRWALQADL
jgi:extracellular elastinolytic metalloproteinase